MFGPKITGALIREAVDRMKPKLLPFVHQGLADAQIPRFIDHLLGMGGALVMVYPEIGQGGLCTRYTITYLNETEIQWAINS